MYCVITDNTQQQQLACTIDVIRIVTVQYCSKADVSNDVL